MAKNLPKTMKAVGLYKYLPISDVNSLLDLEVKLPMVNKNDYLIEVKATAVNPVDTKIRAPKPNIEVTPRVLGFDGAGVIVGRGETANRLKIGDEVMFTADARRSGTNAQYVALDDVHVTLKPKNLSFTEAAAMPLTSVTAYESLHERLLLSEKDKGKTLLIINSSGGVGAIASQLAKLLGMRVIGTASRPETEKYSLDHGVDIVINHSQDLLPQLQSHGYTQGVDYILVNYDPYPYWNTLMQAIKPQGKICLVVDSSGLVDLRPLKVKSVTLVSELMSTRITFNTEDKFKHNEMLEKVGKLLEAGQLKCTLTKTVFPINAANLREAHRIMEEQKMLGKLVLHGF